MSKNYIKKEDIINLLQTITDHDGYIEKGVLLLSIRELDTYIDDDEQMQPIADTKVPKLRSIYNINDTIHNINKYQNEVKFGLKKSNICSYLEKCLKISIVDKKLKVFPTKNNMLVEYKSLMSDYIPYIEKNPLINKNIITSLKELENILGITKGTSHNWQKKGIIKLHDIHIVVTINDVVYNYQNRHTWFKYYDLEEIKNNIKREK